jgi:isoleucyl-tRNA synthetase
MFHIVEAMVRWMAPVLSFTADEIWSFMPGRRAESVFMVTWYEDLFPLAQGALDGSAWGQVIDVKNAVAKQLELMRKEGVIGSSLDAEVELYCDEPLLGVLGQLGDELRFALITSYANAAPLANAPAEAVDTDVNGLKVAAWASQHAKCVRCWHHREDVGADSGHPQLCGRCVENVAGEGETRQFA